MPRTLLNNRIRSAWYGKTLYWLLPSLFCAWIHRDGLYAWYQADDFAWLGLTTEYYNAKTFWNAVFRPATQGNFRPLSERLFFFAMWQWFGWNAAPARIIVLLTQCANLVLLSALVRRISGSALAGFVAPLLWSANAALVTSLIWTSAYDEILCALFLLSALLLFIRFAETGQKRFYWAQLAVFVIGFGALEINLVYPALAAAWCWFYRRDRLLWTAPLMALSAAFYKLHTSLAPTPASGPYHPIFDLSIFTTFAEYWKLVFIPPYGFITPQSLLAWAFVASATLGLLVFLFTELLSTKPPKRRYAAAFFACWFLIVLAPLLPFRDHITHYYLTIPLAGFAALAALAFARSKFIAVPLIAIYFAIQLPALQVGERWLLDRSISAKRLMLGIRQIHQWEPTKAILLTDVSPDLYGVSIADNPFRLIKGVRVYLAPETLKQLADLAPNLAPPANMVLAAAPTRHALLDGQLVVYSAAAATLLEVTQAYTAGVLTAPSPDEPRRIHPGSAPLAYLLGPEWYPIEGAYRWMPARATLRIGGPLNTSQKLYISGFAAPESRRMQPLTLTVSAEGRPGTTAQIGPNEESFTRQFPLPPTAIGKPSIQIVLDVNHTFGRDRQLGLVIETVEIR